MKSVKAPYLMEFYHKDLSFKSRPTFRQGIIFYEWNNKGNDWRLDFRMIVCPINRNRKTYYESKFTPQKNINCQ